jgi:hypothetical protein
MTSTVIEPDAALADIARRYLESLADGNFARVPWSEDVVLRTPLQSGRPFQGRCAVEAFFRPMVGKLGAIRLVETYINRNRDTVVAEAYLGPLHVLDRFVIRGGYIVEQQNVFDPRPMLETAPPGGISSDERMLVVGMLETSRDRMRAALERAPDVSWRRKPVGGGWSTAECAEHLVLSEEALLGLIRGQILSSPANPDLTAELRGKDGIVVRAMHDRSSKSKTFDFLEPKGKWPDRLAALDAFLARRAVTLDYVRGSQDALHYHAAPLGALGLLDAYQWLLLLAAHTDRHLAQMREAVGST